MMHAALPSPGTAQLRFSRVGGDTVLTRAYSASPLKLFATGDRRRACWVYSATLGGGFVGGDSIHIDVDVADDARALLTTQASTKVYRSLAPARQTIRAKIGERALLAVMPDPTVCFADADFRQTQRYALSATASLVLIDWLTSGRHQTGERWAFSRYESRLEVIREGRPVIAEGMLLEQDLDAIGDRMGRFDVVLTGFIAGPMVDASAMNLCERLAQLPVSPRQPVIASASRVRDAGVLVRIAGTSLEDVSALMRREFAFLAPIVGDDSWNRKW